jgi:DNA replication protein DnaC
MLNEPTIEKLKSLRLDAMAAAWLAQQKDPEAGRLDFDERFGLLVDAECTYRENRRLDRLLREAKLRLGQACVEDIDYPAVRKLDRSLIRQLATGRWIREHQNVVISGATGTGKTYIACALAQHACRRGFRTLYRRASRLFEEMGLARADGSYVRALAKFARVDVLVIDDWGLTPVREPERADLLEILEDRCGVRSTIMTSQLDPKRWHDHLGDPTLADAICDRVLHNAHRIALSGPSRRNPDADKKP